MKNIFLSLFFTFLIASSKAFSSAECTGSSHTKKAVGLWHIKFHSKSISAGSIYLDVSNDGVFFHGKMGNKTSSQDIKIQQCEGDCCNGFGKSSGTLNFWAKSHKNFISKKGRVTLIFKEIDWDAKKGSGEMRDQNWNLVSTFKARRI